MSQHKVARTLVKSAPELWEVCSDPDTLGRHLEAFGEIRITRVEPETTVAWEGERASGTVRIEPSGWGTRVILTATAAAAAEPVMAPPPPQPPVVIEAEPEPAAEPEPVAEEPPQPEVPAVVARPTFFRRLGGLLFKSLVTPVEYPEGAFGPPEPVVVDPEPEPEPEPELAPVAVIAPPAPPEPEPGVAPEPAHVDPGSVLAGVLDRLGSDHHRPFSRG